MQFSKHHVLVKRDTPPYTHLSGSRDAGQCGHHYWQHPPQPHPPTALAPPLFCLHRRPSPGDWILSIGNGVNGRHCTYRPPLLVQAARHVVMRVALETVSVAGKKKHAFAPCHAGNCKGLLPSSSRAFTSAPPATSACTAALWPALLSSNLGNELHGHVIESLYIEPQNNKICVAVLCPMQCCTT
jgi:hypothetical protein